MLILLPCFALLAGGVGNICIVLGQTMKHFLYSSTVESVHIMVDKNPGKQMGKPTKQPKKPDNPAKESFWNLSIVQPFTA